ncbi:MAG: class F420-dependent oxidoreductase, partial [Phenylobacterium sp.]|nr:class F420-dependent oxidoreductase [Phenylobacterium sp.]
MKVTAVLPFDQVTPGEFLTAEAVVEISQTVERAGFEGGAVTDHPVPTGRWLDAGGHHAQDPFVMLALVGAATKTLKLHTSIIVVPYRNPFIMARAVSTLDVCTGGRTVLGVGAGYLKGEYFAVGADFDNRNDLTDEYIAAMKAAWGSEEFSFEGTGYQARGARILPLPLQRPHPPIWVGGNSKRAIRRAVQHGDYWSPFHSGAGPVAATARTTAIASEDDLAGLI